MHAQTTLNIVFSIPYHLEWSEMALNYQVILERYPFSNEVVGSLIPAVKSSLYLMDKTSWVGRKPRAHLPQGRQQTPPYTKRILEQGKTNKLKFMLDYLLLVIYLFIYYLKLHNTISIYFLSHCLATKGQIGCLDILEH